MSITHDKEATVDCLLGTPVDAVHPKLRGQRLDNPEARFGRLCSPAIPIIEARLVDEIGTDAEVVVIGYHTLMFNIYIWRGTGAEFHSTWEVD